MHSLKGKEVLVKSSENRCKIDHDKYEIGTSYNEETNARHWNEGESSFGSTAMFAIKASNHQKQNLALQNQPTFALIIAATMSIVKQLFAMNALGKTIRSN